MAWIYFQASVESDSHSNHGSELLPIVSATDTLKASFCPGCDQVKLIPHQSGTMSQPSEQRCSHESISSQEDSPVRISRSLAVELAWMESEVVFSSRSSDSSESVNLDLFSSRMSLPSEPVEGKEWLKSWPRSGMTVDGLLFQPPQLEPTTSVNDGSYLPTPTASDYGTGGNGVRKMKQKKVISLNTMARKNLWPTPRASEYKDCGPVGSKSQIHMEKRDYLCAKAKDQSNPTGQLNPQWVEWLMGYQIGHTELDALATAWFHSKSERRSKNSLG